MAKGQVRGNREVKKPKKEKEVVTAAAPSTKGISPTLGQSKKKG